MVDDAKLCPYCGREIYVHIESDDDTLKQAIALHCECGAFTDLIQVRPAWNGDAMRAAYQNARAHWHSGQKHRDTVTKRIEKTRTCKKKLNAASNSHKAV